MLKHFEDASFIAGREESTVPIQSNARTTGTQDSSEFATLSLPVMEAFYTIQGEGMHAGKAAYFIRLGGCDVGCHWCDVKESWDVNTHPQQSIAEITAAATACPAEIVVITGGEPLMHDLTALCASLKAAGKQLHIETSGAHPISGEWDWLCLSPKKFKAPQEDVIQQADELKVIIWHKSDFAWAELYEKMVPANCVLSLQVEWDKRNEMTPLIVDYVRQHPHWRISLQTHKYMGVD